jgi:hypothetical protein
MSQNAVLPDARPQKAPAATMPRPRRRRRSVLFGIAILLFLAGTALTTLVILLQHEPTFYRRAALPPGPERRSLCLVFASRAATLQGRISNKSASWDETFSEEQLNSFFEEGLRDESVLRDNKIHFTLPENVTDPRVVFEADRIRLGFRYHIGRFSTVVSIAMRVWVTKAEPNVVALEIQGMRAGALPISAQSILERMSASAESNNIKLSWYRHDGNPVAIMRFQGEQREEVKLENFDSHPGKLFIKGGSLERGPPPDAKK